MRAGFPIAVRAQALALVLVVAGVAAGSGLATAGAVGLLGGDHASPSRAPSSTPVPTIAVATDGRVALSPSPANARSNPARADRPEPSDTAGADGRAGWPGWGEATPIGQGDQGPTKGPPPTATPTQTRDDDPRTTSPAATEDPGARVRPAALVVARAGGSPAPTGTRMAGSGEVTGPRRAGSRVESRA